MYAFPDWRAAPAENVPAALADWLCETGSLTERLIASGRLFAVEVLAQGVEPAWPDEAAALGLAAGAPALAREVRLTLDGAPYVYARSLCRADSPAWAGVLARGSRSLGLTLFGEPGIARHPLNFCAGLAAQTALMARARAALPGAGDWLHARRSLFGQPDDALLVHEVFHPLLAEVTPS